MLNKTHFQQVVLILIMILPGISSIAQTMMVSGKILDENQQAMSGVSVYTKGTTGQGTISDVNGNYTIRSEMNATLAYSFVGYTTQELLVTSTQMDIKMAVESIGLEEVVAIGYGSIRKKDISSSIVTVQGSELAKAAPGNIT